MIIVLDRPYSLGDLSDTTYPHCYASRLVIDGTQQSVMVTYEYGRMDENDRWTPTPIYTGETIVLTGEALVPFFFTRPTSMDASLWDQTETIVYREIQARVPRLAGKIVPEILAAEHSGTLRKYATKQLSLDFANTPDLLGQLPITNTLWGCL